jgi:hypothetical protein
MNVNTDGLKVDDVRIDLAEVDTVCPQRFLRRILACCLLGVMSIAALLWLGIMLVQFVHFVCPAS